VRPRSIPSVMPTTRGPEVSIIVRAPNSQRDAVAAALDAVGQPREVRDGHEAARIIFVTSDGTPPDGITPRLVAPWMGIAAAAVPGVKAGSVGDRTMVVTLDASADSFDLPLAMRAVRRALLAPAAWREMEPARLSDAALAAWSRPAPPANTCGARRVDDDDGRWFWVLTLGLVVLETWWRRRLDRAAVSDEISQGAHAV
jgi:hypothetical protein